MKIFERKSPTKLTFPSLSDSESAELHEALSYKNPEVEQELKRLVPRNAANRYIQRNGIEAFRERVEDLKGKLDVSLLIEKGGEHSTLSGFASRLYDMGYQGPSLISLGDDRTPRPYALSHKPPHKDRYYQIEAGDALWEARHGAVSLPTGSGKSNIIERAVKRHATKSVVMAPSRSIAGQLFSQFTKSFGKSSVGMFGDGHKDSKKDVVVGIAASLTKVEDGEHLRNFSKTGLFVADESHLVPASTFGRVCLDVFSKVDDRYFVSATQFRNDGTDILLEGITGPVVYRKTLSELVGEGFLAKPKFFYVETESLSSMVSHDWHKMADKHIFSNPKLAKEAAALANKCHEAFKHPVLILIDEVRQFKFMLPYFRHEVGFAHGPLNSENKGDVDERFQKSDVDELVNKFNSGQLPILVGTSCITTGTDLRPTGTILYLMSGASQVKFMQAVGRGTRLVPGKTSFNFIFFRVFIPGLEGLNNLFERHFREIRSYCYSFELRPLSF
jgi:superfamily II DNA or RNA helicase